MFPVSLLCNPTPVLGGGVVAFDPATLPLTYWGRDYPGTSPWPGTASAGTSGSNSLSGGVPPDAGATLHGYPTAHFVQASFQSLTDSADLMSLISAGAGSLVVLYKADSATADGGDGAPYQVPAFLGDTDGDFGFGFSDAGVRGGYYSGGYSSIAVAVPVDEWHALQMKWDGTNLKVRVDGGSWSSIALGNASLTASVCKLGTNFSTSAYLDGTVVERMISDTTLDDSDFDDILSYLRSRYSLGL